MGDEAFLFHHLQQAEDGGVGELVAALLGGAGVHGVGEVADGSLAAVPEDFQGFEFAVGGWRIGHWAVDKRSRTADVATSYRDTCVESQRLVHVCPTGLLVATAVILLLFQ